MKRRENKRKLCWCFIFLCNFFVYRAQTTLLVGSAETYTTITGAYAACTNGATNYIIEIRSTYTNTEAKPITLGANTAASVIIRPQSGAGSLTLGLVTGTETSIFSFTAGDNITIDGRAGGSGSSVLTIENTQNASAKYAIQFSGGSTDNTIKYCTIKGSNTSASSSSTNPGVIMFGSGTNSNNTIDNCTIQDSGANLPAVGINSYDPTNNNSLTITNNNFVNIRNWSIYANGSNNTGWTITGNSFYQTSTITQNGDLVFIYIGHGGNYTITGNYFGGQAAACGTEGTPYALTGAYTFYGIYFTNSTNATTNVISGNTFKNISHTTTKNSGTHFTFITTNGSANFTIGSSGNGNVFGLSSTGTGSITITDNNASSSSEYVMGYINSTGTNNIAYNTMGGITFNGTCAAAKNINLLYIGDGTTTVSNNTFGNTTANNIINSNSSGIMWGIFCGYAVGTFTFSNNTVQNVQHGGSGDFNVLVNYGSALSCTSNTLKNLTSTSTSYAHYILYHDVDANATISSNTIYNVNFSSSSSSAYLIYVDAGTGAATATVSSNTIGKFGTTNDITLAGNDYNIGIYFNDGGAITVGSNVLQNFNLTAAGTSNNFWGIYISSACDATNTCNGNAIDNISSASTENSAASSVTGIYLSGDGTNTIDHNTITDMEMSSVAGTAGYMQGIYLNFPDGTVSVTKNRITGLTHKSTIGSSNALILGIRVNTNGTANLYNNVVLLNNGSNSNQMDIWGFHSNSVTSGTYNLYHNTIKVYGTSAVGSGSAPIYVNSTSGTFTLKNNLFQNLRVSGSDAYGIDNGVAGPSFTEDYNYVEAATFGYWHGSTYTTFANWKTNTSQGTNDKNSTITVAASGVVSSPTSGDVQNTGMDYDATVPTDIDGNTRHATTPYMGAYEGSTALPIELLHFTALPVGKAVELSWSTATEINNDYFTIERSADGLLFEKMYAIQGAGNSNSILFYTETDAQPLKGLSYYRLKQTDFDGKYSYSQIVAVNFGEAFNIQIFPNPSDGKQGNILITAKEGETINLEIANTLGQLLFTKSVVMDAGSCFILPVAQLQELTKGSYFIKASSPTILLSKKLIVQ